MTKHYLIGLPNRDEFYPRLNEEIKRFNKWI